MSVVSEPSAQRVTLGELAKQYGCVLDPEFATNVTVTSLADTVESVIPGGLLVCSGETMFDDARTASRLGAYGVLLPENAQGRLGELDIPVLYGDLDDAQFSHMVARIAGNPSQGMAMFAVTGPNAATIEKDVSTLSNFLHMLGNPVATISHAGSASMTRTLDLTYPLNVIDVQQVLSVCAEDGVAAVVIALDKLTLDDAALQSTNIDVIGGEGLTKSVTVRKLRDKYAFTADAELALTVPSEESEELAQEARDAYDSDDQAKRMSFAVAMVLAAGVRRSNVRSALRMASSLK